MFACLWFEFLIFFFFVFVWVFFKGNDFISLALGDDTYDQVVEYNVSQDKMIMILYKYVK